LYTLFHLTDDLIIPTNENGLKWIENFNPF